MADAHGRQRPSAPLLDAGYAFPQWSPDSKRVLVAKATGQPNDREMCWVDVDTRRVVATGVHIESTVPHLSPDGARFAFFRLEADGSTNVWTQSLAGGAPRRITSAVSASYPAWSPDGRWLAIELEHDADMQVGIVPADGGPVEQLTTDPGLHFVSAWAPDGDRVTYAGARGGVWNIYTVSRRTRRDHGGDPFHFAERLRTLSCVVAEGRPPGLRTRDRQRDAVDRPIALTCAWRLAMPPGREESS